MKWFGWLVAVAAAAVLCDRAQGQASPAAPAPATARSFPSTAATVEQNVAVLQAELQRLEAALRADEQALAADESRYQAGLATSAEVQHARSQAEQTRALLIGVRAHLAIASRLAALRRPVDVQFKDAGLSQVAGALQKASGLAIRLGSGQSGAPAPPSRAGGETRLSVRARGVPLAAVLETVAETWGLEIAPDASGGVRLRALPVLEVDGQKRAVRSRSMPWSDEWAIPADSGYFTPSHPKYAPPWQRLLGVSLTSEEAGLHRLGERAAPVIPSAAQTAPPAAVRPASVMLQQQTEPAAAGQASPTEAEQLVCATCTAHAPVIALGNDRDGHLTMVIAERADGDNAGRLCLTAYSVSPAGEFVRLGPGTLYEATLSQAGGAGAAGSVALLIPLRLATADAVVSRLRSSPKRLLPPEVGIWPDSQRNAVIVSGTPAGVYDAIQAVSACDADVRPPTTPGLARAGGGARALGRGAGGPGLTAARASGAPALAEAIRQVNAAAVSHPVGKGQPPLTEGEVVAAIRWITEDRGNKDLSAAERATLARIVAQRVMADGATFETLTGYTQHSAQYTVWSVRLVLRRPDGSHAFVIRERFLSSQPILPTGRRSRQNKKLPGASTASPQADEPLRSGSRRDK